MKPVMYLRYAKEMRELSRRYESFSALEYHRIKENCDFQWDVPCHAFFQGKQRVSILIAMFIGKTGYGKSSILNQIIGKTIFPINDIDACTNRIDTAFFRMDTSGKYYLSLSDLPGIGESEQADMKYLEMYRALFPVSKCVIYTLRADQRDYSIDEHLFRAMIKADQREHAVDKRVFDGMFPSRAYYKTISKAITFQKAMIHGTSFSPKVNSNIIIALNCADKIEPLSRTGEITSAQKRVLEDKVGQVQDCFGVDRLDIVPCSAQTGYGIDTLVNRIVDKLSPCVC